MNKCLAAVTLLTESPPFLNASLTPEGKVEMIVRGNAKMQAGRNFPVADIASMQMERETFRAWLVEALATLDAS